MPDPPTQPDPLVQLELSQLRRRTSSKWRRFADDVLPMWVAEMDVALAEPVAAAAQRAIELGDTGYAAGPGYAEALSSFAVERWGWELDPASAVLVPDLMSGVADVIRVLSEPGDAVVINPPVYAPFFAAVANTGRRLIEAPLGPDGRLDQTALDAAFAEASGGGRAAVYLLCSPHNPTGTVHTGAELAAVAELAERHGVRVVVDEIHSPLVFSGARFVPYLSLRDDSNAFALHSASKAWNLAGMKAALAVAGAGGERDLARLAAISHPSSHLGVITHTAALLHGRGWLDSLLAGLERNRDALAGLLAEQLPEVGYRPGDGTFLAWLDCRRLGLGEDPSARFLERGRVALNPGPSFGAGGEGFARLNFACPPQLLAEGVRRMAATVGG